MAAQTATNVKLYSGDLIPYPQPVVVGNHGLTGTAPVTLHALYDPATGDPVWLVWDKDVDIITPAGTDNVDTQRFYYTGDGAPKVSTYDLATTGAQPYPADYYDLGLPLPDQTPTATETTFTTKTTATYERDAGGLVTMTTSTAHGLKSGAFVTVSGFTNRSGTYSQSGTRITVTITGHGLVIGSRVLLRFTSGTAAANIFTVTGTPSANTFTVTSTASATTSGNVDWDITSLNATSIEITVVDSTTFTYTSPGFQVSTITSSDGRVDLAGATQARSYLYTWFTPWEEESIGSLPSDELYIKEGQTVTVSNLPTAKPAGKNQVQGIRLYRTLSTVADTEYLRLATLWFPVTVDTVVGTTVTTVQPHNLSVGNYFKISTGVAGGEVTDVTDEYTFTYTGGVGSGGAGGTLYHDVSENPGTSTPRYWGDGSYDFTDDFNVASLLNALVTDDYDPPPEGLKGLTLYNNNILVGFDGNEIYFSEPGQYHAWPRVYKKEIPYNIVGLAVFSGYLLVATESYPYLIAGNDPAVLSLTRVDARYPCLNKRSIANMGFGVLYATHDGLALYSTTTGPQLATRLLYNSDTWNADLDPTTLIGTAYKDTYLAWHSAGGISFERDDRVGGFFVDLVTDEQPEATWYDPITNSLYYATGTNGDVYLWDDLTQPAQPFEWKSKVIVTENPVNIGAAQVDADYAETSPIWDDVTDTWNTSTVQWDSDGGITFKLWVDGDLVLTQAIDSRNVFRLPRGYRSDTFEVGVEGSVRLKTIRIAETPTGLREV
ncbi:MAG TPA: hypothetical protein VIG24_04750 [Acidimicrobiia bacterium]